MARPKAKLRIYKNDLWKKVRKCVACYAVGCCGMHSLEFSKTCDDARGVSRTIHEIFNN